MGSGHRAFERLSRKRVGHIGWLQRTAFRFAVSTHGSRSAADWLALKPRQQAGSLHLRNYTAKPRDPAVLSYPGGTIVFRDSEATSARLTSFAQDDSFVADAFGRDVAVRFKQAYERLYIVCSETSIYG